MWGVYIIPKRAYYFIELNINKLDVVMSWAPWNNLIQWRISRWLLLPLVASFEWFSPSSGTDVTDRSSGWPNDPKGLQLWATWSWRSCELGLSITLMEGSATKMLPANEKGEWLWPSSAVQCAVIDCFINTRDGKSKYWSSNSQRPRIEDSDSQIMPPANVSNQRLRVEARDHLYAF